MATARRGKLNSELLDKGVFSLCSHTCWALGSGLSCCGRGGAEGVCSPGSAWLIAMLAPHNGLMDFSLNAELDPAATWKEALDTGLAFGFPGTPVAPFSELT